MTFNAISYQFMPRHLMTLMITVAMAMTMITTTTMMMMMMVVVAMMTTMPLLMLRMNNGNYGNSVAQAPLG